MRFNIRHLLWFTLLAAVGCWWWFPSANDAAVMNNLPSYYIDDFCRFNSAKQAPDSDLMATLTCKVDFAHRDCLLTPSGWSSDKPTWEMQPTRLYSRGRGLFVGVCPGSGILYGSTLISLDKHAWMIPVSPVQAHFADAGVAIVLLTLAIGSLFVGRKRLPAKTTSLMPISN